MNPLTAVMFLLTGVALVFVRKEPALRRSRWSGAAAAVCAGAVAALALVKLSDFMPGPIHIDQVLFASATKALNNSMAPNTAVAFAFLGVSLLLLDAGNAQIRWAATALTLATAGIALLAVTGYLYSVLALYKAGPHIPMAVNTAACFMLLCLGILTARPDREPLATLLSATAGGVVARRLLPAALVIPLLVGLLALKGQKRDLYEVPFMMTLFTLTNVVIFVALIWWNASSLRHLDEQRRQMEQTLREAEAVYHSLVETLPQNIFRKDLDGRFTFGNSNYCKVLGMPLDADPRQDRLRPVPARPGGAVPRRRPRGDRERQGVRHRRGARDARRASGCTCR